ncbi:MAG: hypothetical protein EON49_22010 [Acidovorax sp.]|nr:MAG: hypothetical protein EON49_22010 [Acidovorax sp.]
MAGGAAVVAGACGTHPVPSAWRLRSPLSGCAASPQGDATRGLAEPVPLWHWRQAALVGSAPPTITHLHP